MSDSVTNFASTCNVSGEFDLVIYNNTCVQFCWFRHCGDNDNSLEQKGTLPGTIYAMRFDLKRLHLLRGMENTQVFTEL